jgi:flagellar motor protein MotB
VIPEHKHRPEENVDSWLMSYADMITLLCMFFVIFVSATYSHYSKPHAPTYGEPEHAFLEERSGALSTKTVFERTYKDLVGVVAERSADESVAVEKNPEGIGIDMAGSLLFAPGSASIARLAKRYESRSWQTSH